MIKKRDLAICAILVASGLGMCIAGIFIPPLLVLGAALLAGGLTVGANILHNKDRITVNNNYSVGIPDEVKEPVLARELPTKKKLQSFFAFKNKKFMNTHKEFNIGVNPQDPVEVETKTMEIPSDMLAELDRLNDAINSIDFALIAKVAQQFRDSATSQHIKDEPH